jgi:hypothetical protein
MRPITFPEFLAATDLNNERIKVLRQRDQIALAFGRSEAYQSLGYIELDAVAHGLAEVLADKLDRTLAANIVRDLWGVWTRIAAQAETRPAFLFVIEYEDKKGRRDYMVLGKHTDSVLEARAVVMKLGLTPKNYFIVDMPDLLATVRRLADQAGYDFKAPFLPPFGSAKLEEVLEPFKETDRAVVVTTDKAKQERAEQARRAGIMARATIEANLPAMPRGRLQ